MNIFISNSFPYYPRRSKPLIKSYPLMTISNHRRRKKKDGERNGQGKETHPYGDKYVGEFKDDKKHGKGTFTTPDGHKYFGEYKDGKKDGQGTYIFSDGRKYEGEFKDGKLNGHGILILGFAQEYVGVFKEGTFWNITEYDKNRNIIRTWVNGKGIKP